MRFSFTCPRTKRSSPLSGVGVALAQGVWRIFGNPDAERLNLSRAGMPVASRDCAYDASVCLTQFVFLIR
jgi:hypothetical protein